MASLFKLVGEVFIDTAKANQSLSNVGYTAEQSTSKFTQIGTTMQTVGQKMTQAGGMLTAGVTMPILGIGAGAVKTAADFEASMSNVAALSGATGDELDLLEAKAREMGSSTKFSATEAADAFSYMALAGWDTGSMLEGIEPILKLATAANMDLGEASDIVTDYLTAFGLSAEDAGEFVDQMAYAMANSNTDVTQLGEAYKNCASTATSMGVSVEDTTAALMVMANAGVKGGEAGTALNGIMTRLATDTSGCATELSELGVEVYNTDGSMREFGDIMTDMGAALAGMTDEEKASIQQHIAGKSAYSDLAILLADLDTGAQRTTSSFADYTQALSDCEGTATDMADVMEDNLNGQLTTLKSSLEEGAIAIGQALLPMVKQLTEFIQKLVTWFNGLNEKQKDFIIKIAMVAAAIGPILVVVGLLASSIGSILTLVPLISTAITTVKLGMSSLLMTLSMNPAALVIAGIVALVLAFIYLWNNCEGFRNFWINLWDNIKIVFQAVVDWIQEALENIKEFFTTAWEAVQTVVTTVFNVIYTIISTYINIWLTIITTVLNAIKFVFTSVWDGIKTYVSTVMSIIQGLITNPLQTVRGIVSTILNGIKTTFTTVFNGIKTTVSGVVNWLKGVFNFSWSLPHIKLPHFSKAGEFSLNPPSVPTFSVSWYKKGMEEAQILDGATIFGKNGSGLLGGGEAGREVISGENHLISLIRGSVSDVLSDKLDSIGKMLSDYLPECAKDIYIDGAKITSEVEKRMAKNTIRRGGAW